MYHPDSILIVLLSAIGTNIGTGINIGTIDVDSIGTISSIGIGGIGISSIALGIGTTAICTIAIGIDIDTIAIGSIGISITNIAIANETIATIGCMS